MSQDREYQNYVNKSDKLLREIDEVRLKLSRKLRTKSQQDQLAYFGYTIARDQIDTKDSYKNNINNDIPRTKN